MGLRVRPRLPYKRGSVQGIKSSYCTKTQNIRSRVKSDGHEDALPGSFPTKSLRSDSYFFSHNDDFPNPSSWPWTELNPDVETPDVNRGRLLTWEDHEFVIFERESSHA
ncbi:uncharacterized protein RCO7_15216 [Rhynchosporium graminicola]|uniref:Uncharacterized protein n=1 Tax=Rhynchosporium graminicola TaxID=2792576 RepID=A0A1E1LRE4_9HELO|nr:uncharacterized protein RCO7_15216 [Rhynchosporium commune]